jgi:hypothetical protein
MGRTAPARGARGQSSPLSLGQLGHTGRSPKVQRKAAAFARRHRLCQLRRTCSSWRSAFSTARPPPSTRQHSATATRKPGAVRPPSEALPAPRRVINLMQALRRRIAQDPKPRTPRKLTRAQKTTHGGTPGLGAVWAGGPGSGLTAGASLRKAVLIECDPALAVCARLLTIEIFLTRNLGLRQAHKASRLTSWPTSSARGLAAWCPSACVRAAR